MGRRRVVGEIILPGTSFRARRKNGVLSIEGRYKLAVVAGKWSISLRGHGG